MRRATAVVAVAATDVTATLLPLLLLPPNTAAIGFSRSFPSPPLLALPLVSAQVALSLSYCMSVCLPACLSICLSFYHLSCLCVDGARFELASESAAGVQVAADAAIKFRSASAAAADVDTEHTDRALGWPQVGALALLRHANCALLLHKKWSREVVPTSLQAAAAAAIAAARQPMHH